MVVSVSMDVAPNKSLTIGIRCGDIDQGDAKITVELSVDQGYTMSLLKIQYHTEPEYFCGPWEAPFLPNKVYSIPFNKYELILLRNALNKAVELAEQLDIE